MHWECKYNLLIQKEDLTTFFANEVGSDNQHDIDSGFLCHCPVPWGE